MYNFTCMYVCVPQACTMNQKSEKGIRYPGTEVTDSCELPDGCWEVNLGPLPEQQLLLTAKPFL